jgi:3-oxoacyl-[acyl-carrier-protein] synthase-1
MTKIISTNITSPLGLTTEENYAAVKRGETGLKVVDGCLGVPGRFCVGIFSDTQKAALQVEGFSWFESLVLHSVKDALARASVDPSSPRTVLILGTSTAGIEELGVVPEKDRNYLAPGVAAKKVADKLGFVNNPITVSNACISGATAQMLADRLISFHYYDTAVVCGVDALSAFVLAGFESFKALSPTECRPFDIERLGLNIGECAATVVLSGNQDADADAWYIVDGCLTNDAYHVSAPVPSGDGVCRAIKKILTPELKSTLACVAAHGTATMFNDQMESKAIEGAGLGDLVTTALKPHYGHTFGASGIVEAIITMCSLDEGLILPILGFEELGVSGKIKICSQIEHTDKKAFIKLQSGFGGCNGAMVYAKTPSPAAVPAKTDYETAGSVRITPDGLWINGLAVPMESHGPALLTEIYKKNLADQSRFFKMDLYSRLAYVGTGLLAKDALNGYDPADLAIFIFTQNGSVLADRKHLSSFSNPEEFYPSPAVFINTLPNVVLGEIAVKNNIKGETTLVLLPSRDEATMNTVIQASVAATRPSAVIYGWVDCDAEDSFIADLKLMKIK